MTTSEIQAPFIEADANAPTAELRALMDESGYLFFRGLVPGDAVLAVRREVLGLCAQAGWLAADSDPMDAIVAPTQEALVEGQPDYSAVYRQVLKLPRFHDFPNQPALLGVARKLLQSDEVLVHPRRIGRLTFPNQDYAPTPPHQDWFYIRGAVETYSCWMPLGECPMNQGGLAVWPGSQHHGFMEHDAVNEKAVVGTGIEVDESEAHWHTGDFESGDALFFHSHTVHKALPNRTNRLRISTDNRFQRPSDEIDPNSLVPHNPSR